MSTWTIETTPRGLVDVLVDRRGVAYDRDDLEEALLTIRRDRRFDPETDEIVYIHANGYREPIDFGGYTRLR